MAGKIIKGDAMDGVLIEFWLRVSLFLLPLYVANSSALILGGGTPIDFGKRHRDGNPLLGKGKTWRGALAGVFAGSAATAIVGFALPPYAGLVPEYLLLGILLSIGAIGGDIIASYFKRRNSIGQGEEVIFLDQLDFVFGGLVAVALVSLVNGVYIPDIYEITAIALVTIFAHKISNFVAFKAKLKKVPW